MVRPRPCQQPLWLECSFLVETRTELEARKASLQSLLLGIYPCRLWEHRYWRQRKRAAWAKQQNKLMELEGEEAAKQAEEQARGEAKGEDPSVLTAEGRKNDQAKATPTEEKEEHEAQSVPEKEHEKGEAEIPLPSTGKCKSKRTRPDDAQLV